jgi:hypothetical protein
MEERDITEWQKTNKEEREEKSASLALNQEEEDIESSPELGERDGRGERDECEDRTTDRLWFRLKVREEGEPRANQGQGQGCEESGWWTR